ncbi:Uncharacterised protein [Klebsiella variicola]|uniref:hypothetical protein n=1 Tax=Klebsiella variicola TaxID=244366 RepID=UPI000E2C3B08|nr:hypothetical protein [Klebsiella variicola]SXF12083.1 Uncharacterised protein [Klebsiella variicola]
MRGKVIKINITVSYPDGSIKEATFDDIADVKAIYFTEDVMSDEMKSLFNVSNDWKENPTVIVQKGDVLSPRCKIDYCPVKDI